MSRRNGHHYRRLTGLDDSHPVLDNGSQHRPPHGCLAGDGFQARLNALDVGVILEMGDPVFTVGVVASRSDEHGRCSRVRTTHLGEQRPRIEGLGRESHTNAGIGHMDKSTQDGRRKTVDARRSTQDGTAQPRRTRTIGGTNMSDDLFSQFFRLFDAPGPVNLRLAAEVAHHLVGESQPVDPWAAEEFRELTRLAEFKVEAVAPFAVHPAPDVMPVDARRWVDKNLEPLSYLAEPFGGIVDLGGSGPEAQMLAGLAPAMIGIQLGTLVGTLGGWVMAGFDAGVPARGEIPITYVLPNIEDFATRHDSDPRQVRLWAALNEASHRALFRIPFVTDHLVRLLSEYAGAISIGPEKLMEMFSSMNPEDFGDAGKLGRVAELFDTPAGRAAHEELASFLGVTGGYRRLLATRAAGELLPSIGELDSARDTERDLGDSAGASALTATFVEAEDLRRGTQFCLEVERRYGSEALAGLWRNGRFPTAGEIADPVTWAARVLLDDIE